MTTTTAPPAVAVEYPFPFEKGAYVARVAGPHGRFGLDREFLDPETQNKREGRATYRLTPGWYVTRTRRQSTGKPNPEQVLSVGESGVVAEQGTVPADRDELRRLGKAGRRGENPDTPGAYRGRFCWCGEDATRHQGDTGRARCDDHYKPTDDEEEPLPPIYDPEPDYDQTDHYDPRPPLDAWDPEETTA